MLVRTNRQERLLQVSLVLLFVALVAGCGGVKEDPILQLSAEEALEIGKELMEKKKYSQAREYLSHTFEVAPNSAAGREALLLVADAYYLDGGSENFIRAEAKYRDFLNRFPVQEDAEARSGSDGDTSGPGCLQRVVADLPRHPVRGGRSSGDGGLA
jgi:outer membrane protein assembly factor BamD (BamD/ComL family)